MAHGAPIRIETLGDLVAHDYILNAMCERCRHRIDLDMQALIDKLGEGFIYVGRTLDGRPVYSRCGARAWTGRWGRTARHVSSGRWRQRRSQTSAAPVRVVGTASASGR
jgi:hypothetical protein